MEGCPNSCNNGTRGGRSLCAKGAAAPMSLNTNDRLLYPMKRVGEKGPGAQFERISWDEALDTIAETLLAQKKAYGAESFGILSPQNFAVLASVGRRFLNVHGSPNYLHSAICFVQRQASVNTVLGGPAIFANNSTMPAHLEDTELLVRWGINLENSAINQGLVRNILLQQKRGMKVIDVRPVCDCMVAKADEWVPVRPGTDLALAIGILHVIFAEGLYDKAFCEKWVHGFDELAEHLGQFSVSWACEHSGISEQQITSIAREIAAANPCAIMYGNGVGDQSRDGYWTMVCIQLIGAVCGNIGKSGGGADGMRMPPVVPIRPFCDVLAERLPRSAEDEENGWPAGHSKLVSPEFPRWYTVPGNGGPTSSYLGGLLSVLSEEPYPLRAIFAQSTNPLSATRQPELVVRCLEKLDFYFVMDQHFNPSCEYADIVLPAASSYECSDQIGIQNNAAGTFIAINQKLADPPGEAMSDWEFYLKLAYRMGYGADFWDGEIDGWLREQLEHTGITLEQLRATPDGIFLERPQSAQESPALPQAAAEPNYAQMFSQLPFGKAQGANAVVGGKAGAGAFEQDILPSLPVYHGPSEGLAETPELAKEYPYIFSDVHAHRLSEHSYYNNVGQIRSIEAAPWVKINPKTAAAHHISEGDWVRIESPHGWCVLCARLTETVSPEVLMARRGWWQGCKELGIPGYHYGNGGAETNALYSADPKVADKFSSSYGKQTLVKISRSLTPPLTWEPKAVAH